MDRQAWRAQLVEAAIDPQLPIVDAHHHVWPEQYMEGFETYPPSALLAEKSGSGHNIRKTVFVEGHTRHRADGPVHFRPVGETEYANALGEEADRAEATRGICSAIVATADMSLGDRVEEVLQAHWRAAPERLRGIRALTVNDPDFPEVGTSPDVLAAPKFRAAVARLEPNNLSLDIFVFHPQLPAVAKLAAAFPNTRFVLNHVGGPLRIARFAGRDGEVFAGWSKGLKLVAANANVALKLGGLAMAASGLGPPLDAPAPWSSDRIAEIQRPYILHAIEMFGPNRCMFESNFPVDRMVMSETVLWNAFKKIVEGFSADEKRSLFSQAASAFYRL